MKGRVHYSCSQLWFSCLGIVPKGWRQFLRLEGFAALLREMPLCETSPKELYTYTMAALSNKRYLGGEKLRGKDI